MPFPDPVIHTFAPIARLLEGAYSRLEYLTGAGKDQVKQLLWDEIRSQETKVLSLDVFDTLLLRNDKPEAFRFREISQFVKERLGEKAETMSDVDLLLSRVLGMTISYRCRPDIDGCREGSIEEVIRTQRRDLNLPPAVDQVFLQAEIDYEAANLTPNQVLIDVAKEFRAQGGVVVLVSDMYLGEAPISLILRRLDIDARVEFDGVFSSCDHIVSKRASKLFTKISSQLRCDPEACLHVGDSVEGDVFQCRAAGWRAVYFPVAREEAIRRTKSLDRFKSEMAEIGLDVSQWAKL